MCHVDCKNPTNYKAGDYTMLFTSTLFLYCHINSNCTHTHTHTHIYIYTTDPIYPNTRWPHHFTIFNFHKDPTQNMFNSVHNKMPLPPHFSYYELVLKKKKIQIYSQTNTIICTNPELSKYAPMYPSYNLQANETRTAPTSSTWLVTLQLDKYSSQHYPPPNAYVRTKIIICYYS